LKENSDGDIVAIIGSVLLKSNIMKKYIPLYDNPDPKFIPEYLKEDVQQDVYTSSAL